VYTGVWDVTKKTYASDGIRGFYRGLLPSLAKVCLKESRRQQPTFDTLLGHTCRLDILRCIRADQETVRVTPYSPHANPNLPFTPQTWRLNTSTFHSSMTDSPVLFASLVSLLDRPREFRARSAPLSHFVSIDLHAYTQ